MGELVERCLGSAELAQRLVTSFRQRMSDALTDLERAVQAGDAPTAAKVAHQLKGSAANVSAAPLRRLLARIEQRARDNQIEETRDTLLELRSELDQLNVYCDGLESNPA
jgi:HPt (histidine-containing phosphotransfer) domain-containing protein